jgi:hypothetical protein
MDAAFESDSFGTMMGGRGFLQSGQRNFSPLNNLESLSMPWSVDEHAAGELKNGCAKRRSE